MDAGFIVGNIGLSASAESVHQAKRPSRRNNATRHHPHRSSSRRNKENGSSRSGSFRNNGKTLNAANHTNQIDDVTRINRKSRAVSFDQSSIVAEVSSKLCNRNNSDRNERNTIGGHDLSIDAADGDKLASDNMVEDGIIGFDLIDIGIQTPTDHHFKPPRV